MITVTTAASNHDLTTLNTVKAALNVSASTDDGFIADLITEASLVIRRYCNRVFAKETVVETIRLSRPLDAVNLVRWPVTAVASVVEDGATLQTVDYETDLETGLVYRLDANDRRRLWTAGKLVITYTAGYVLPIGPGARNLPTDIESGCVALVRFLYHRRGSDPYTRSVDAGAIKLSLNTDLSGPDGLPPEVVALIGPHRLPSIA